MADVPHRRVVILRDTARPLWFMRCVPGTECGACSVCWLGSALDRERVVKMAKRLRYEVVEDTATAAQGEAPAASSDAAASRVAARR